MYPLDFDHPLVIILTKYQKYKSNIHDNCPPTMQCNAIAPMPYESKSKELSIVFALRVVRVRVRVRVSGMKSFLYFTYV